MGRSVSAVGTDLIDVFACGFCSDAAITRDFRSIGLKIGHLRMPSSCQKTTLHPSTLYQDGCRLQSLSGWVALGSYRRTAAGQWAYLL